VVVGSLVIRDQLACLSEHTLLEVASGKILITAAHRLSLGHWGGKFIFFDLALTHGGALFRATDSVKRNVSLVVGVVGTRGIQSPPL